MSKQTSAEEDPHPQRDSRQVRKAREKERLKLIEKAQKQMKRGMDYEAEFRARCVEDIKFANGDDDNKWQWPQNLQNERNAADKPVLTANVIAVHNALVVNEIRKNPPSIKIVPTGGLATVESAKTYSGLVREISRVSKASDIYCNAAQYMVDGGVGYWRVLNEYEHEKSMDQVIRIRSVTDPLSVVLDCDIKEPDGSDANWGFIFGERTDESVEDQYGPDVAAGSKNPIGEFPHVWSREGYTLEAEWYDRSKYQDELVAWEDEQGGEAAEFASVLGVELSEQLKNKPRTRCRTVVRHKVTWRKLIGCEIVSEKPVPGEYIPIVRICGKEVRVEGQLDRKGQTRALKSVQKNLNYWLSESTAQVALQSKTQWVGALKAFENLGKYWETSNTKNYAFLPFNHVDDEGNVIPPPQRMEPPNMGMAYIKGLEIAGNFVMTISGQHEPQTGEPGPETSGRAILFRKQQGDTSSYHFTDSVARGVALTGRIIVSMVPQIYDTPRLLRITNEDMTQDEVQLDPQAAQAHAAKQKQDEEAVEQIIFNPRVGTYDIDAEAGPDWATQRQWTVDAMAQVLGQNKELWTVMGDVFVKNMDFPGADELAERIRRTINPSILGIGPTPNEQQLQQQLQAMNQMLAELMQKLAEKQRELEDRDDELALRAHTEAGKLENRAYDSVTKRIKEVGNAASNLAGMGMEKGAQALAADVLGEAAEVEADGGPSGTRERAGELTDITSLPLDPPAQPGGAPL